MYSKVRGLGMRLKILCGAKATRAKALGERGVGEWEETNAFVSFIDDSPVELEQQLLRFLSAGICGNLRPKLFFCVGPARLTIL